MTKKESVTSKVAKALFDKPNRSRFLEKEMSEVPRRVLWIIPFHRGMMFFAAFIIQACHGTQYAWSTFGPYVEGHIAKVDPDNAEQAKKISPIVFQVAMWTASAVKIVTGPLILRYGPRVVTTFSALAVVFGFVISALSLQFGKSANAQLAGVFIGNGILAGTGTGFGNPAVVMATQRYFPDHIGIAVGVSVSGFAVASFFAFPIKYMVDTAGLSVPMLFYVFAGICATLMLPLTQFMRFPPPGFTGKQEKPGISSQRNDDGGKDSKKQLLEKRQKTITTGLVERYPTSRKALYNWMFMALAFVYFGCMIPGNFFIPRAGKMITATLDVRNNIAAANSVNAASQGNSMDGIVLATVVAGIGNLAGRMLLGPVAHRIGALPVYAACCFFQTIALGLFILCLEYGYVEVMYALLFFVGASYGYSFAGVPLSLVSLFSRKWLEILYPLNICFSGLFAIVSTIFSFSVPKENYIFPHIYFAICVAPLGLILAIVLSKFQRQQTQEILKEENMLSEA